MPLTFNADHVRFLLEESRKSDNRRPTYGQLADPQYWRDDMDPERRKSMEAQFKKEGFAGDVVLDDIDRTKIPAGLNLVGDQGIYLMSNAEVEPENGSGFSHVCYAKEADHEKMDPDECYDAKRAIFGGDDGVEFIAADDLDDALDGEFLKIDMSPEHFAIYKSKPAEPGPGDPAA